MTVENSATCIRCKFGHKISPLASVLQLVANFAINGITPGHGVNFWVRSGNVLLMSHYDFHHRESYLNSTDR